MTEAKPLPLSADDIADAKNRFDNNELPFLTDASVFMEAFGWVGSALATIDSLQAENAALVEAAKNLMPTFEDGRTHSEKERAVLAIISTPTSAGAALLKRLEDAEERCGLMADANRLAFQMRDQAIEKGAEWKARAEAAEAEVERLRQNQRTPHTVEVCEKCYVVATLRPNGCTGTMMTFHPDCPLRSQEKK
jgi:hypothetical protein